MRRPAFFAAVLVLALLPAERAAMAANVVTDGLWVPWSSVDAVVCSDSVLYVGGDFGFGPTRGAIGPATGGLAPLDPRTGKALATLGLRGVVKDMAPDGNGGWFVAGAFTSVKGKPRANLAHVTADFRLSSWNPGADGSVETIARVGTVIYVGGGFRHVGGAPRRFLASIDAKTGAVTDWNPDPDRTVLELAPFDSILYVGGSFRTVGEKDRSYLAAVDPATGGVTPWSPGPACPVLEMVISGRTAYTAHDGGCLSRLDAWDLDTGEATAWHPNPSGPVWGLAIDDGIVYAAGGFQSIGGEARHGIAAVDADQGAATSWAPGAIPSFGNTLASVAVTRSVVYVGGGFTAVGGEERSHIVAFNRHTGETLPWDPLVGGLSVHSIAVWDSTVWIGGDFHVAGSVRREAIAALDLATGKPTPWISPVRGHVRALLLDGRTLYAAGALTVPGSRATIGVAALDLDADSTAWATTTIGSAWALALDDSVLYVGGDFWGIGGQQRYLVAALDARTGVPTDWNVIVKSGTDVQALAVSEDKVYIGGLIGEFDGSLGRGRRKGVAAVDKDTGALTPWMEFFCSRASYAHADVHALALHDSTVFFGGDLICVDAGKLVAVAATGYGWPSSSPERPNGPVTALAVNGSRLYVGGDFTSVGGEPRNSVACFDIATRTLTPWNPGATGRHIGVSVRAFAFHGRTAYLGGYFLEVGGRYTPNLAAVRTWVVEEALVPDDAGRSERSGPTTSAPASGVALRVTPNPASGLIRIEITQGAGAQLRLSVHDVAGRLVSRIVDEWRPAERSVVTWDGRGPGGVVASGVYFVRAEAGGHARTERITVVR